MSDGPASGSTIPNKLGAITLFVGDVARSKAFYAGVFGAAVAFEDDVSCVFRFGETVVNLLQESEAPTLVEPGRVGSSADGARFVISVWVADTDACCEALRDHGVGLVNGPVDRPWGQRTATFSDPDGYLWELAQAIG